MSLREGWLWLVSGVAASAVVAGCGGGAGSDVDAFVAHDGGALFDAPLFDAPLLGDSGGPGDDAGRDAGGNDDAGGAVDAAVVTDAGGSLTACGGRTGGTCGVGEFCDYGTAMCGITDGSGVCRGVPTTCPGEGTGVCGCDGTTYLNACEAARASTSVRSDGPCRFACGPDMACVTGREACRITTGGAPPGFTSYACTTLPTECTAGGVTPSCATCFGTSGLTCDEPVPGQITVTLLAP